MKKNGTAVFFLALIFLCSCEELTETDLSNFPIKIIAPVDSLQTTSAFNTFAWEEVKGTVKYQIQIVSPKFDSVVRFVVDSSLKQNLFTDSLSPGRYQWRIRAINNSSQTAYFVRTIIFRILNGMNIDSSPSIVPAKSISKFKDTNSYETYDLLANYEDPFGADSDTLYEKSSEDSLIKLTANFLKNSSPLDNLNKPDISFIKYKGLIINPVSHKKIAIISMNGKEEFVTAKFKIDKIKVNTIQNDKIQITYLNERYWIKRE